MGEFFHGWRRKAVRIVGVPVALSALAVCCGFLNLLVGVLAAVVLILYWVLGEWLGPVFWKSARTGRWAVLKWLAFGITVGVCTGIEMASIWGAAGGTLFGVLLSALVGAIGYVDSKLGAKDAS